MHGFVYEGRAKQQEIIVGGKQMRLESQNENLWDGVSFIRKNCATIREKCKLIPEMQGSVYEGRAKQQEIMVKGNQMRLESQNENLWDGVSFIRKDCATIREKCKLIPEMHGSVYEGRAKEQGIIVGGKQMRLESQNENLWDGVSFIRKNCATIREKCKLIPEMHGSVYEGRAKQQEIIVGGKQMRLESQNENLWDGVSFIRKDCATIREKCKLIPEMHGSVYEGRAKQQEIIVGGKQMRLESQNENLWDGVSFIRKDCATIREKCKLIPEMHGFVYEGRAKQQKIMVKGNQMR